MLPIMLRMVMGGGFARGRSFARDEFTSNFRASFRRGAPKVAFMVA